MTPLTQGSVIERPAALPQPGKSSNETVGSPKPVRRRKQPAVKKRRFSSIGDSIETDGLDALVGEAVPLTERLVVSPCSGRFHAAGEPERAEGLFVLEGQELGKVISSDRENIPVLANFSGWLMGYLVPQGSPVRAAEPVVWLRPQ